MRHRPVRRRFLKESGFTIFDQNIDRTRLTVHAWRDATFRKAGNAAPRKTRNTHPIWRRVYEKAVGRRT